MIVTLLLLSLGDLPTCDALRSPFADTDRHSFDDLHSRVVSKFGDHRNSYVRGHKHAGIDLSATPNEKIYPICAGRVANTHLGFPHRTLVLEHRMPDGATRYSSYKHIEDIQVAKGDLVTVESNLARLFSSKENKRAGFSRVHLHLEIRSSIADGGDASWTSMTMEELEETCIDPLIFLRARMRRIIPRKEWDETPSRLLGVTRYRGGLKKQLSWIVVHHSSFAEPPGPVGIEAYHQQTYGWSDIGYHFVIATDGSVFEGRPLTAMGAHAGQTLECNQAVVAIRRGKSSGSVDDARKLDPDWGSVGIVIDGNSDWGGAPTEEQRESLQWLVDRLMHQLDIDWDHVITHREVRERIVTAKGLTPAGKITTCPGESLQELVEQMRNELHD